MKYGEKIVTEFDVDKDLEIWPNEHKKNYLICWKRVKRIF